MAATEIESLDDIIFQNRNKAYGAYQLRKNQDKNSLFALIIICGVIAGFIGADFVSSLFAKKVVPIVENPGHDGNFVVEEYKEYTLPALNKSSLRSANNSSKTNIEYRIVQKTKNVLPLIDPSEYQEGPFIEEEKGEGVYKSGTDEGRHSKGSNFFEEEKFHPELQIDEVAVFPGGEKMFEKYIKENYKFPEEAIKENLSGILFVYFEIDENGKVKNVKITHSFPGAENFEAEAVRVISSMPDWTPRKLNGKPIRTRRELQINCKL